MKQIAMKRLFALVLFVSVFAGACATLDPAIKVETFGMANPLHDKKVAEHAEAFEQAPPVYVTQGQLPEGVEMTDNNMKIAILPGYEQRYQILGVVEADYMAVKGVFPRNLLWTWKEYDSTGRKIACYAQAPLKALTLGTWALLPWAYPCFKFAPKEPSDREIGLLNQMRKGAAAMGGNIIIITAKGDLQVTTISQHGSSIEQFGSVKLRGYVIQDRTAPHLSPPAILATPLPSGQYDAPLNISQDSSQSAPASP